MSKLLINWNSQLIYVFLVTSFSIFAEWDPQSLHDEANT